MKTHFVYWCITRLCREYHKEFRARVSPLEARASSWGPMTCAHCKQPARLIRSERQEVAIA